MRMTGLRSPYSACQKKTSPPYYLAQRTPHKPTSNRVGQQSEAKRLAASGERTKRGQANAFIGQWFPAKNN